MCVGLLCGASWGQGVDAPVTVRAAFEATGVGVQIYKCETGGKWAFVAPEAKLFAGEAQVGTHGAGPVWVLADGSSVKGTVVAKMEAPAFDAVPWLLLSTTSVGGAGRLAAVTFVRRSATSGGVAPEMGCDAGALGTVRRVPYSATYTFYVAAAGAS